MSVLLCLGVFIAVVVWQFRPIDVNEIYERSLRDFDSRCRCCGRRK